MKWVLQGQSLIYWKICLNNFFKIFSRLLGISLSKLVKKVLRLFRRLSKLGHGNPFGDIKENPCSIFKFSFVELPKRIKQKNNFDIKNGMRSKKFRFGFKFQVQYARHEWMSEFLDLRQTKKRLNNKFLNYFSSLSDSIIFIFCSFL